MASMQTETLMKVGALAIGAAQPFILRQYADKTYGSLVSQLGVWGTPSALAGIIGGGGATAAALLGMFMGVGVKDPLYQEILLAYGVPALAGSVAMAAVTQTVATSQAAPQAYFASQQGQVGIPKHQVGSAAARNYASLTQPQRNKLSVY